MEKQKQKLIVQAAPYLSHGITAPKAMLDIIYALIPVALLSVWFFGISSLWVIISATLGGVLVEWLFNRERADNPLKDGSAILTGLLLGLTLPAGLPLWMAFLGGVVAIGLGKTVWGGLGNNLFNPALLGRAFLLGNFPIAMTTWPAPIGDAGIFSVYPSTFTWPFMQVATDSVSGATPLNLMKFQHQFTDVGSLFIGNVSGSYGETSALLLLVIGGVLILRRSIDWRIPAALLGSVFVLSLIFFMVDSRLYPNPFFMLFSGGLMFAAVFMATDPVTSPLTPKGAWIFGIGMGAITVLIRLFGGLPEGVMYAVLLMNATVPLIDKISQPRAFGHGLKKDGQ
jgi:electron transport complex protein RnfD